MGSSSTPSTTQYLGREDADGVVLGKTAASKIALWGATAAAQRASAAQATSLISVTSTAVNTSIVAWMLEVSNTLTALGAWKGSA